MNRRRFLALTAAAGGAALWPRLTRPQSAARPNVLLLVTDDWGWPYYGFMRPEVGSCLAEVLPGCDLGQDPTCQPYRFPSPRTPNLDALVAGGICFPWGISTASRSTAARQSIQTGLNRATCSTTGPSACAATTTSPPRSRPGGRVTIPLALDALPRCVELPRGRVGCDQQQAIAQR